MMITSVIIVPIIHSKAMTKKDYIIIAKAINNIYAPALKTYEANKNTGNQKENQSSIVIGTIWDIMGQLMQEFIKDNHRFDWDKFKQLAYEV